MTETRLNGVSGSGGGSAAPSAADNAAMAARAKKALDNMVIQPVLTNATKVIAKNYESIKNSGKA
jgi:hypothetical protein